MTLSYDPIISGVLTGGSSLLARVTGPEALRELHSADLPGLAAQIRAFLAEKACATGANLGVVELTIALHRVFRSPYDVLLFDTGHQAHVHKILTGRQDRFGSLRQEDGLPGYPAREESEHDWVENSHSSTALAYADGLAKAFQLRGETSRRVVAVIGDGALTGGLALESLSNLAAGGERPVIIVLNDNGRSHDPAAGGLARHLESLRTDPCQNVFELLGLEYVGPVDGHDLPELERALRQASSLRRPVVVHTVTEKGRGHRPAETDRMPGVTWTDVFGEEMLALGSVRPDVVCLTAAMLQPVGLKPFADRYPGRVFDSGIAEQHTVCSAAGLAMGGLHPFVCVHASFLNRAFDQVLMDVALHQLPVTFVLDRAGITGPDGPSHHGMWDTSILAAVPGLRVAAPRDPARLRELLHEAADIGDGPTVVRYPRSATGPDLPAAARMDGLDILYRSPHLPLDVLLIPAGPLAEPALAAAETLSALGIGVTVADPRWIQPVHPTLVHLAARHRLAVTLEDASRGFGAAFARSCADAAVPTPIRSLGLPTAFLDAASRTALLTAHGLTPDRITETVLETLP